MESSTLRRCLNVAGKGYMAGVKLGLNCLERSAKNLIALIRFIELNEFNASKKTQIDREDIPAKMGFVCKDTLSWLIQIGEEKSSKAVTNLIWYTEKVADARRG